MPIAVLLAVPARRRSGWAAGQDDQLTIDTVDDSSFPSVMLTVSVPAALAGSVLPADAFHLEENGQHRDAQVLAVASTTLDLILIVDTRAA